MQIPAAVVVLALALEHVAQKENDGLGPDEVAARSAIVPRPGEHPDAGGAARKRPSVVEAHRRRHLAGRGSTLRRTLQIPPVVVVAAAFGI